MARPRRWQAVATVALAAAVGAARATNCATFNDCASCADGTVAIAGNTRRVVAWRLTGDPPRAGRRMGGVGLVQRPRAGGAPAGALRASAGVPRAPPSAPPRAVRSCKAVPAAAARKQAPSPTTSLSPSSPPRSRSPSCSSSAPCSVSPTVRATCESVDRGSHVHAASARADLLGPFARSTHECSNLEKEMLLPLSDQARRGLGTSYRSRSAVRRLA